MLKSVLQPSTVPDTSGIPSDGGTGRLKYLLSCSQKIGWVLLCAFLFIYGIFKQPSVVCQCEDGGMN